MQTLIRLLLQDQSDQALRYKKKFLLNSAEHKIVNAHTYKKKNKEIELFSGSDKPVIVGILTLMSRKNCMLS